MRVEQPWMMAAAASGRAAAFSGRGGLTVLPGKYTVKIKYEDQEVSQTFEVRPDPRVQVDLAVLKANYEKAREAQSLSRNLQTVSQRLQQTQRAFQTIREFARSQRNQKMTEALKKLEAAEAKLKELMETLNPTPPRQGLADRSAGLQSQVSSAVSGIIQGGYEPITPTAMERYENARKKFSEFADRVNSFYEKDVAELNKLLQEAGFTLLQVYPPLRVE